MTAYPHRPLWPLAVIAAVYFAIGVVMLIFGPFLGAKIGGGVMLAGCGFMIAAMRNRAQRNGYAAQLRGLGL